MFNINFQYHLDHYPGISLNIKFFGSNNKCFKINLRSIVWQSAISLQILPAPAVVDVKLDNAISFGRGLKHQVGPRNSQLVGPSVDRIVNHSGWLDFSFYLGWRLKAARPTASVALSFLTTERRIRMATYFPFAVFIRSLYSSRRAII